MLRKLTALLVLMALFVVPAAANEYVEGAYALFVEQMAWTTDEQGERQILFTLPNMGKEPIQAYVLDVVMLDDNDQPVLASTPDMEGFKKEITAGYVSGAITKD